jgi:hypothetical protein
MNVERLPPSLLLALGLGCGPSGSPDDGGGEGIGTNPATTADTTFGGGPFTSSESTENDTTTFSPCLLDLGGGLGTTGSTGTSSGSGSGTDTDTDTDTGGTESGSSSGSNGGMEAGADVMQRVLASGVLPPDVARKLAK